jgi:hypothetical protein
LIGLGELRRTTTGRVGGPLRVLITTGRAWSQTKARLS